MTLYSNNCPRCNILKAKLDAAGIPYTLVDTIDGLKAAGLEDALFPILEVGSKRMSFGEANTFIASHLGGLTC